jgi:trk system potassium uptake protein TrkH
MSLKRIEPTHKIILSFLLVIFVGTLLLHLPLSSGKEKKVHLRLCLFTATSAVCVTGLTINDTGKDFSLFGQVIILILIQVGGLGILTFSNWLVISLKGQSRSLETRFLLSESHGSLPHIRPIQLLRQIVWYTLLCEGLGTLLLFTRFIQEFSISHALWQALFHSIAAFCNAGFSLFTNNLMNYRGDVIINLTIMGLIILGGLGFVVMSDLTLYYQSARAGLRRKHVSFHTKVVLWTTLWLLIGFAAIFMMLEWENTMHGFSLKDRLLASFFLSVTPRTAGFNTVDTGLLSNTTLSLEIFLMGVGAAPGSTGGGIKVSTFAVLVALIVSRSRGRQRVELRGRTIPMSVLSKAIAVGAAYTLFTILGTMLIEFLEARHLAAINDDFARGLFLKHLFEVVSALGTVGLSTGITASLAGSSQILLVFVMLIGRLGPLLLAESLVGSKKPVRYSLPEDVVLVG